MSAGVRAEARRILRGRQPLAVARRPRIELRGAERGAVAELLGRQAEDEREVREALGRIERADVELGARERVRRAMELHRGVRRGRRGALDRGGGAVVTLRAAPGDGCTTRERGESDDDAGAAKTNVPT